MRSTSTLSMLAAFATISLGATSVLAQAAPAPAPAPAPPANPTVVYVVGPAPANPNAPRTANNSFYVELLGPGLFYSINYDRTFGDLAGRVGLMYFSVSGSGSSGSANAYLLAIPLTLSYIGIGSKKHIFEVGGGVTILSAGAGASGVGVNSDSTASGSATTVLGHLVLGYRMQPPDGGFFFRAGISPLIGSGVFVPWPYVGLGATF